jgi:pimeloyl-ACP methyl ester carboxylesterase
MSALRSTSIVVPGWNLEPTVLRGGSGAPLVWLHGIEEPSLEDPVLNALAEHFEVVAPIHPGFHDVDDVRDLRDVHDLALYHDDLLDALGLDGVAVAGVSFGGMVAAELAAHVPGRVSRLVLATPMGLWMDDQPAADPFTAFTSGGLKDLLWGDETSPAAQLAIDAFAAAHAGSDASQARDADTTLTMMVGMVQGLTTVGKYIWPLPDKGLRRRLHRISAPTLVVWGKSDRLIPATYGDEFTDGIADARLAVLDAGHMAPYEDVGGFVALLREHVG